MRHRVERPSRISVAPVGRTVEPESLVVVLASRLRTFAMSMDASPENGPPRPRGSKAEPIACERCGAPVELVTALPRRIDHSAYRIFACTACNFVQWIPD
jgi:hypothetical protein